MNSHYKKIQADGFTLLKGILPKKKCEQFKEKLENHFKTYSNSYATSNSSSVGLQDKTLEKVVYNLHNKDLTWFELFEDQRVLDIIAPHLQEGSYKDEEPYYLYNISARCPLVGNPGQQLHLDSNLSGVNRPIIMNAIWYLDDSTKDNGATRAVPGSHKYMEYAKDGVFDPNEVILEAEAGDVLVFNGSLWHGGGPCKVESNRWAVLLGYARWFIRPSFDYMHNMPEEMFSKLTDNQKSILGYNCIPPKDEFTRVRRRTSEFETPFRYSLPK